MSNRIDEISGGRATYPLAAATEFDGTALTKIKYVSGFILAEDGAVSALTYDGGKDWDADYGLDYSACKANVYYHLPQRATHITCSVAATLVFYN